METTPAIDPPVAPEARMQRATGRAEARFERREGASRLIHLHQSGCLKLRFPRLPDRRAEGVLINSSGGLAGGDRTEQRFEVGEGADLTVTTQACERAYRASAGSPPACVTTSLKLHEDAGLFWLPQETILFEGADLRRRLDVDMPATGRLLACEAVILGREKMGELAGHARLRERWRVRVGGRLAYADDLFLPGDPDMLHASRASLGGHRAFATVIARLPSAPSVLAFARERFAGDEVRGGATMIGDLMALRATAVSGFALRKALVPVLAALATRPLPLVWSL